MESTVWFCVRSQGHAAQLRRLAQEQLRLGSISQLDFFDVEDDLVNAQAALVSAVSDTCVRAANISYPLGSFETGE